MGKIKILNIHTLFKYAGKSLVENVHLSYTTNAANEFFMSYHKNFCFSEILEIVYRIEFEIHSNEKVESICSLR